MVNQQVRIVVVIMAMLLTASGAQSQPVQLVERLVLSSARTRSDDAARVFGGQADEAIKRLIARIATTGSDVSQLD